MRRFLLLLIVIAVGAGVGLWITRPQTIEPERFANLSGDATKGEMVFWAGGCASCHVAPESTDKLVLAGGQSFVSDFGTFKAPNISTDSAGLGNWTLQNFANAMLEGTSPEGSHYYPAFPYGSYARMTDGDVADLWAFMQTLPADATPSEPHDLAFPFSIRASVGGWKLLFFGTDPVLDNPPSERGQYLVEALGHCAECHTPRNILGALETSRWMAGAPNPSGKGRIPGLTPTQLSWSASDIAYY
ncbi:MAG: cytochrome c, partial [Boseongicola sp.]|nr:cytochrome c [Boseongicola sp.]